MKNTLLEIIDTDGHPNILSKMTIKEIKKLNSLSDADIAQAFGYKSTMAYSNSSAKKRIDKGIEYFYNLNK
jgi:hypothetical protein